MHEPSPHLDSERRSLPKDLPDHLYWLTERVESLVRPAAFLKPSDKPIAPLGGTFMYGMPDVPMDATWAVGDFAPRSTMCSPFDGYSHWLQLNLEDIPGWARKPEWPAVGVVWLFIKTCGDWAAATFFDPRPAAAIPWRPRDPSVRPPRAAQVERADTLLWATEKTLPEIASDWREGGLAHDFDEWVWENFSSKYPSDVQLGGWVLPCQGEADDRNETFVVGFHREEFGDNGACYLHFDPSHGFFGIVETH